MKRNLDLIRELVLYVEQDNSWPEDIQNIEIKGYSEKEITYNLFLMWEAELIEAIDCSTHAGPHIAVLRLTWAGHEFAAKR